MDYYDQMKSLGMQRAADISMKAMCEQMQFDENDINEIIMEQRNMIKDMEHKILDLEEENRLLNIAVSQLKGECKRITKRFFCSLNFFLVCFRSPA